LVGFSDARRERYKKIRERETRWIMQLEVRMLNRFLAPLLIALVLLDFLDVSLTVSALYQGPVFIEFNRIAHALFDMQFWGFLAALLLKYVILIPIAYGVHLGEKPNRPVQVRVVKLGTLAGLVGADLLMAYIVTLDGFNLLSYLGQVRA
jgi:hypothetical protein